MVKYLLIDQGSCVVNVSVIYIQMNNIESTNRIDIVLLKEAFIHGCLHSTVAQGLLADRKDRSRKMR